MSALKEVPGATPSSSSSPLTEAKHRSSMEKLYKTYSSRMSPLFGDGIPSPKRRGSEKSTSSRRGSQDSHKTPRALTLNSWIDATRPLHLTVGDVLQMPIGQKIKLVRLSAGKDTFEGDSSKSREDIFQQNQCIMYFTRQCGMSGILTIEGGETNIGWDLDGGENNWSPVKESTIPTTSTENILELLKKPASTNLPPHARIGYKGPVILWSDLDSTPALK